MNESQPTYAQLKAVAEKYMAKWADVQETVIGEFSSNYRKDYRKMLADVDADSVAFGLAFVPRERRDFLDDDE